MWTYAAKHAIWHPTSDSHRTLACLAAFKSSEANTQTRSEHSQYFFMKSNLSKLSHTESQVMNLPLTLAFRLSCSAWSLLVGRRACLPVLGVRGAGLVALAGRRASFTAAASC